MSATGGKFYIYMGGAMKGDRPSIDDGLHVYEHNDERPTDLRYDEDPDVEFPDELERRTTRRVARVTSDTELDRVHAYMPRNYRAVKVNSEIRIVGHDVAGWTLDGYVIPRLASGLIFAEVIDES